MLSHSPPLPLIISYDGRQPLTAQDEEGALLALQKHDYVRFIHLCASTATLDKLLAAMNGPFPLLDNLGLCAEPSDSGEDESEGGQLDYPRLPQSFQAPHLRQLDLTRVGNATEVGLPVLASLTSLVDLILVGIPASSYLSLDSLVLHLSLMPKLEFMDLEFEFHIPSDDIARERIDGPNVKQISLPNLTGMFFEGPSSYLERLAAQITAPHLTLFRATLLDQPSSALPHLSALLTTAAGLRFPIARIKFPSTRVFDPYVAVYMANSDHTLDRQPHFSPFRLIFQSRSLYAQVAATGKICAALAPMLSVVGILHLAFDGPRWWTPHDRHIENARWHDLLRPFCKVEKLQVDANLWDLSHALSPNDDGLSMEILPELRKILRSGNARFRDAFDGFIAVRRDAGRHIVKRRRVAILYLDSEDSAGEEDDADEEDSHGEEEQEQEGNEGEGDVEPRVEDDREAEEGGYNSDSESDGTDDDPGFLTEIDSDTDSEVDSKSKS
jgi:hypothetical protein